MKTRTGNTEDNKKTKLLEKSSASPLTTESEYKKFLNNYIVKLKKKKGSPERDEIFPDLKTVTQWILPKKKTDLAVQEDIFKKFNNHNILGIKKIFKTENSGDLATYGHMGDMLDPQSKDDYTYISLPASYKNPDLKNITRAKTIAHEVVHANDHQIDGLTPKVWNELYELYKKKPGQFDQAINKLRSKIDNIFATSETYNPATVKKTMNEELNQFRRELPSGTFKNDKDTVYNKGKGKEKWQNLKNEIYQEIPYEWKDGLPEMVKLTSLKNTRDDSKGKEYTIPNYHFKGTFASEFPAFMGTNLTRSWKTDQKGGTKKNPILALNRNEQTFLNNTLGHMMDTYPENNYPTINKFLRARSDSIESTPTWTAGNPILGKRKQTELSPPQSRGKQNSTKRQKKTRINENNQ